MIRATHDGPVTTITLDREDKRNAMTPEMLRELRRLIEEVGGAIAPGGAAGRDAERSTDREDAIGGTAIGGTADGGTTIGRTADGGTGSTRALVLAGKGSVFCAGFDLAMCAASPDGSVMRALLTGLSACIAALRTCPCPVVIAAHGAAIAGGCALLGGADVVVADRAAKFGYPVLRIGVSPAVSGPFMATKAGFGATRARMLDTALISGEEAARIGLVHEVVDGPGDVLPRARAIAAELAAKPAGGMTATKRWLNEIEDGMKLVDPERALAVSMGLTGGEEERLGVAAAMQRK